MSSSDLAVRLTRVLDEDERLATAVPGPPDWSTFRYVVQTGKEPDIGDVASTWPETTGVTAAHIARHDPARTLRMAAAHRRILELHRPVGYSTPPDTCGGCHDAWPCGTVRALAEAYGVAIDG